MIYKTLHWYIFRELLRNFLVTAAALTTLLAFGSAFKPLTKQGLDVAQLMWVILNAMPAMLAYTIPLSALFAAVLSYGRLSTDNEITACRAGGISFHTILVPALVLGVLVSAADLVFVNYVVPVFAQRFERAVRRDIPSMLVYQIGRQEPYQFGNLIVYADEGFQQNVPPEQLPPGIDARAIVELHGMAGTFLGKDGKPTMVGYAQKAFVIIDQSYKRDEAYGLIKLVKGIGYNPATFAVVSGTIESFPASGKPMPIPSLIRDNTKFLNVKQLWELRQDPTTYPPIEDLMESIQARWRQQQVSVKYREAFRPNVPITFEQGSADERVIVTAPAISLSPELVASFTAAGGVPVKVELIRHNKPIYFYTAEKAELQLADEDSPALALASGPAAASGTRTTGALQLSGNVQRRDVERNLPPAPVGTAVDVQPLLIPEAMLSTAAFPTAEIRAGTGTFTPKIQEMGENLRTKIHRLVRNIGSEMHSRISFAVSCLTLVLLGAALGILMRARNPLLVFVVGFMPAVVLVLLIVTGRKIVENTASQNGIVVIWLGNVILLSLVVGVYTKLLRH